MAQRRWASKDSKDNDKKISPEKPFYYQLQESIYERVQKEKAEQISVQSLRHRTARGEYLVQMTRTALCQTR